MDAVYSAIAALAMGSPFLATLLILAYYYIFRVPWWRKRTTGKRPRFFWATAGVGTVLLGLTLIYRPRLQFAVEVQQRQVEDADEYDNGDPDSNRKHLFRQLGRIRWGEAVETLSVRLK